VFRLLIRILQAFVFFFAHQAVVFAEQSGHFLTGMVPEGRSALQLETRYGKTDAFIDKDGNKVSFMRDLDGLNIDPQVLPLLGLFGPAASLGTLEMSSDISGYKYELTYGYGVTENLSVGFILPYGSITHHINAKSVNANLAINPVFDPSTAISPINSPFIPHVPGVTQQADFEAIQFIVTSPDFGFEYERIQTVTTEGVLDPTVGLRWHIPLTEHWSAVLAPGVRIGHADKNNPDDLFDVQWADGSTDILLGVDVVGWIADNWAMRTRLKYTWQTPDTIEARAYSVDQALVPKSNLEVLDRDLGDRLESLIELDYIRASWLWGARLEHSNKQQDNYSSPRGQDVSGLEEETDNFETSFVLRVQWSGINAWRNQKLPIPVILTARIQTTIDGENVVDSDNLFLTITTIF